jgi:hypothetical protein
MKLYTTIPCDKMRGCKLPSAGPDVLGASPAEKLLPNSAKVSDRILSCNKKNTHTVHAIQSCPEVTVSSLFRSDTRSTLGGTVVVKFLSILLESGSTTSEVRRLIRAGFFGDLSQTEV